ncbi:unnamed protein product [Arabidopsis halleri]
MLVLLLLLGRLVLPHCFQPIWLQLLFLPCLGSLHGS